MVKGDEQWVIDVSKEELEMTNEGKIRRILKADKPIRGTSYIYKNAYFDPLENGFHYVWEVVDKNCDWIEYESFEECKKAYEQLTKYVSKWERLGLAMGNARHGRTISLRFMDEEKAVNFMRWLNDRLYPIDFESFDEFFQVEE